MRDFSLSDERSNQGYFERTPEKLVLEGYRYWIAGYDTDSIRPWEACFRLFSEELGAVDGRRALSELSNLVRTMTRCADCPLRRFPYGSHHICLEESLTMALISGKQNMDELVIEVCVSHLSCPMRGEDLDAAATCLAETLTELDQIMLPVPFEVIREIIDRSGSSRHRLN